VIPWRSERDHEARITPVSACPAGNDRCAISNAKDVIVRVCSRVRRRRLIDDGNPSPRQGEAVFVWQILVRRSNRDANVPEDGDCGILGRANRPRRNIGLNPEVDDESRRRGRHIGTAPPARSPKRPSTQPFLPPWMLPRGIEAETTAE
jgi:hypothetical protein